MVPGSSGPPASWELARFEDGVVDFPVDYATAAVTDTQGLAHLKRSPGLRARVATTVQGPPGHGIVDVGRTWCFMSWFPSGEGDGRYRCYWGNAQNGEASSLLIDFGTPS